MELLPWPAYRDKFGGLIDWSGISGVWSCEQCDEQGLEWSARDTSSALANHRRIKHGRPDHSKAEPSCSYCDRARHARGMCKIHFTKTTELEKKILAAQQPKDIPVRHGTRTAYVKHFCKCWECVDANSEYSRQRRSQGRREAA